MKKFNKEIDLLKSLREDAAFLHALPPLAKARLKSKILASLKTASPREAMLTAQPGMKQKLFRYIIPALLGISLIGGTAFASNSAVPGDALYPIKKIKETIELNLAPSESSKAQLQAKFAGERLNELAKVHAQAQEQIDTQAGPQASALQAEHEAQTELKNAIQDLTEAQTQLEAKGNTEAAASIGRALLRLQGVHQGGIEVQIEFPQTQRDTEKDQTANSNNNDGGGLKKNNAQAKVEIKLENAREEHDKPEALPTDQLQNHTDFSATGTQETNTESATSTPIHNQIQIHGSSQGQENEKTDNEPAKNFNNANELQNNLNNVFGN